jgi:type 1 glutamine amidotransferase
MVYNRFLCGGFKLMKILLSVVLSAFVGPLCAQSQAEASKIQVLIITGQNRHDWRSVTPVLRRMLEDTGRFEVRVTEEFRGSGPETLALYDLIVVNYFEQRLPELRWGDQAQNALLDFVRSGKGLVIYHFSLAAFDGWEEYEKLSAGNWRPNHGHHSPRHDFTVQIQDRDHPITRGLKESFLQLNDELYANLKWQPAGSYHVVATAWDDHSLYRGRARQPIPGPGRHQPVLWTVQYGQGRVFTTALGHDAEAVQGSGFSTTFTRGAEWAATGKVTLPIPQEMK